MSGKVDKENTEEVIMIDCEGCSKYRDEIIRLRDEIIKLTTELLSIKTKNNIKKRREKEYDYIS